METTIIICLSLALVIAIGMIIAIEVYYRKINKLINWVKFQITANTELMKMSGNNYEQGLFNNGSKTAYIDVYNRLKSFN